jgi:hypothetical protein
MDLQETKKLKLELMESSKSVYLSTTNPKGYPITTRIMVNVRFKFLHPEFVIYYKSEKN